LRENNRRWEGLFNEELSDLRGDKRGRACDMDWKGAELVTWTG
jgi:hypothetical protein